MNISLRAMQHHLEEEHLHQSALHLAGMAGYLTGVGDQFGSQLAWDVDYPSAEMFSEATKVNQDVSHVFANPVVDERPLNQRKARSQPLKQTEWDKQKSKIESYYMEKNFTLAATMEIMKEMHQFTATEKMYKDKFKQWQWSKNLPKAIAARMLNIYNQRWPKRTVFWRNNRKWSIERIKKLLSRHSAEDSSLQEGSSIPDDFTYGTPPSSGTTDNESTLENPHGAGRACVDTAEDLCKFLDAGPSHINSASEAHSLVQEARKAVEDGRHQEAEAGLRDALSFYSLQSPISRKTLDTGHLLASFYIDKGHINDAHCILDWMTKKHEYAKSCNPKIMAHVHNTIAFLRRRRRDEEAESLIYRLLENHQSPEAHHFLLQCSSMSCIKSMGGLLALSNHDKLATMLDILKDLSSNSNNHKLLEDLLPQYIQECDQQRLGNLAIYSRCLLVAILAEDAQFERAINTAGESEQLLKQQCTLDPSTLKLTGHVAFTFLEINDLEACFRVLNTVLENLDVNEVNESDCGYRDALCSFLISTVSGLHKTFTCEQSHAWMNEAYSRSQTLFGANHQCTKQVKRIMDTCDMNNRLENGLFRMDTSS